MSDLSKVVAPIGLMLPVSVRSRLLIQRLWKNGYSWDANVNDSIMLEFKELVSHLQLVGSMEIPRSIKLSNSAILNILCDASTVT